MSNSPSDPARVPKGYSGKTTAPYPPGDRWRWVCNARTRTTSDKAVLSVLAEHANSHTLDAFVHMTTIAKEARVSRATAMRSVSHLEADGFIEVVRNHRERSAYGLLMPVLGSHSATQGGPLGSHSETLGSHSETLGSHSATPNRVLTGQRPVREREPVALPGKSQGQGLDSRNGSDPSDTSKTAQGRKSGDEADYIRKAVAQLKEAEPGPVMDLIVKVLVKRVGEERAKHIVRQAHEDNPDPDA